MVEWLRENDPASSLKDRMAYLATFVGFNGLMRVSEGKSKIAGVKWSNQFRGNGETDGPYADTAWKVPSTAA